MSFTLRCRLERRLGVLFGAFRAPKSSPYRWWPLFVGPVGPMVDKTYWQGWGTATGFEVSVFGFSVYIARAV